MSTGTSVPRPRASGLDLSDSALLDTLLSEAPIGFAFVGTDLRFRRVNQALARMHGLDPADYIGRLPSEVWPDDLGRGRGDARRVLDAAEPVFDEDRAVPVVEQVRHWSFSWYPSHDSDGVIAGVVLIAVEQSHRRTSAEELRRSQERYRSLVQAGAQVVWVTTPDRRDRGGFARVALDHRPDASMSSWAAAGWTRSIPTTASGSSRNGATAWPRGRRSTAGTGSGPGRAPTGTTTCARCRSSGTGRSSSGSAPAPTSPGSARPRRCAAG